MFKLFQILITTHKHQNAYSKNEVHIYYTKHSLFCLFRLKSLECYCIYNKTLTHIDKS